MGNTLCAEFEAVTSPDDLFRFVRDRAPSFNVKEDFRNTRTLDAILSKRPLIPLISDPKERARVVTYTAWLLVHFVHEKPGRGIASRPDVADLIVNYLLPHVSGHAAISNIARTINVICAYSPDARAMFSDLSSALVESILTAFGVAETLVNVQDLCNSIRYIIHNDSKIKAAFLIRGDTASLGFESPYLYEVIFEAVDRVKAKKDADGFWVSLFPRTAAYPNVTMTPPAAHIMTPHMLEIIVDVFSMLANCTDGSRGLAAPSFCERFVRFINEFMHCVDEKTAESIGKLVCYVGLGEGKQCFIDVPDDGSTLLLTNLLKKSHQASTLRSICHGITTIANTEAGKKALCSDGMIEAIFEAAEKVIDIVKSVRESQAMMRISNSDDSSSSPAPEEEENGDEKVVKKNPAKTKFNNRKKKSKNDESGDDDDDDEGDDKVDDDEENEQDGEAVDEGGSSAQPQQQQVGAAAVADSADVKGAEKTKEELEAERRLEKKLAKNANETVYNARASLYHVVHCISSLSALPDRAGRFCTARCLALFHALFPVVSDDLDFFASAVRNTSADNHNTQVRTVFQLVRCIGNMTRSDSGKLWASHPQIAAFLVNAIHDLGPSSKELVQHGVSAINNLCKRNRPMIDHFMSSVIKKDEKEERNGATALCVAFECEELVGSRTIVLAAYCLGRIAEALPAGPKTMNTRKLTHAILAAFARDTRFEAAPYFLRLLLVLIEFDTAAKIAIATNPDNIPLFATLLRFAKNVTNPNQIRELLSVVAFTLTPLAFVERTPSIEAYNVVGLQFTRKRFATSADFRSALLDLEISPHINIVNESGYHMINHFLQRGLSAATYPLPSTALCNSVGKTLQELKAIHLADIMLQAPELAPIYKSDPDFMVVDDEGGEKNCNRTNQGIFSCYRCGNTLRNRGNTPNSPYGAYGCQTAEIIAEFAGSTRPVCPTCRPMHADQLRILKASNAEQVSSVIGEIRSPLHVARSELCNMETLFLIVNKVTDCLLLREKDDDEPEKDNNHHQQVISTLLQEFVHSVNWIKTAPVECCMDEQESDPVLDALLLSALPHAPTQEIIMHIAKAVFVYASNVVFGQKSARIYSRLATPAITSVLISVFEEENNNSRDVSNHPAAVTEICNIFLRMTHLIPASITKLFCTEESINALLSFLERTQNCSVSAIVMKLMVNLVSVKEWSALFVSRQRFADVLCKWLTQNLATQVSPLLFINTIPILDLFIGMSNKVAPERRDRFLGEFPEKLLQLVDAANRVAPVVVLVSSETNVVIRKAALCINNLTWNSPSLQVVFSTKRSARILLHSLHHSKHASTIEWLCGAIENICICEQGIQVFANKSDSSGLIPTMFGINFGGPLARQPSTFEVFKEACANAMKAADTSTKCTVDLERMYNYVLRNESDVESTLFVDAVARRIPFQGIQTVEAAKEALAYIRTNRMSNILSSMRAGEVVVDLFDTPGFKISLELMIERIFGVDALVNYQQQQQEQPDINNNSNNNGVDEMAEVLLEMNKDCVKGEISEELTEKMKKFEAEVKLEHPLANAKYILNSIQRQ